MLYRYRFYNIKEKFVASAEVVELYDNYAILQNKSDKKIEIMILRSDFYESGRRNN